MWIEDNLMIHHFAGAWSGGHSPAGAGGPASSQPLQAPHPKTWPKGLRDSEKRHSPSHGYDWGGTGARVSAPEGGCFAHPIAEVKVWKLWRSQVSREKGLAMANDGCRRRRTNMAKFANAAAPPVLPGAEHILSHKHQHRAWH